MEQHLLLSSIIESLVYFNQSICSLDKKITKALSSFSFSFSLFYEIDLTQLQDKLAHLAELYKDRNLKIKSMLFIIC